MPSPLRLGIIGGGLNSAIGRTHHIASQMDNQWRITCGCFSQQSDVNYATAEALGLPKDGRFTCWQSLLDHGRMDAVAVLTPTPAHPEMIHAALERGIPVISEKSLAVSAAEVGLIRSTEKRTGGFLCVTFNYSGYPMIRELREWIQSGRFGRLLHIDAQMPQEAYIRYLNRHSAKPRPQAWRLRDYGVPTVSLDLGVHLHHLIDFLCGAKPTSVCALQTTGGFFPEVIDAVECLAQYSGGLTVRMQYGKCFLGQANGLRVRISGTEAAAEWHQMRPEELLVADKFGSSQLLTRAACDLTVCSAERYTRFKAGHPAGYIEAFANYYADVAAAVRCHPSQDDDSESSCFIAGSDSAFEGLAMMEAINRSSVTGKWVHPERILEDGKDLPEGSRGVQLRKNVTAAN